MTASAVAADSAQNETAQATQSVTPVAESIRSNLQWKRYAAFEADLLAALELPQQTLCSEFGVANCIRDVHLAPLGGHDPFRNGQLESTVEPLVTTPTVVDRVVLAGCAARLDLELQSGQPSAWFGGLALGDQAPAASSPNHRALIMSLYQRFMARDADEQEIRLLGELTTDASGQMVPARDYVLGACYAVGTSSEFLFF